MKNHSIKDIASEIDAPLHYVGKILQQLVKAGIIASYKGPNGGFKALEETLDVSVADIISAIDGLKIFNECVLGFNECSDDHPCHIHFEVVEHRNNIFTACKSRTIAQIVTAHAKSKFKT